jgi:MFS family permease
MTGRGGVGAVFGRGISPWYLVCVMGCGYAVSFFDRSLVAAAGGAIKHDLRLSDSQFGLLHGSAFVVLYSLSCIPLGRLADRVDRRWMIAIGMLFWTAMTLLCGLAGSFALFLVARIGVGLGEASLAPAALSLIGAVMPRERMGRAIALFIMGATIGNAAALLGGGFLLTRLGPAGPIALPLVGGLAPWQVLFVLAVVPGLIVAGLVMGLKEPPRTAASGPAQAGLAAALGHIGRHRRAFGFLTAASCCTIVVAQAQAAWMPQFYTRHFGLAPGTAAMLVGLLFLISAPTGQLAGGFLSDRLQARGNGSAQNTVMALCLTLALLPGAVFCTTDRLWLSALTYPLFVFCLTAATPSNLAGLQLLTPDRHKGFVGGLFLSIVTLIGIGLGPLLVGLLTDHLFHDERALGRALLVVILASGAAGAFLAWAGRTAFARSAAAIGTRAD